MHNHILFFAFKRSFFVRQGELVEYYYTWKKTPTALSSRPHRRRRHNVLRRKALPRTSKNIVSEFGKYQCAIVKDCYPECPRHEAKSLHFNSFALVFSSVDLSSCSEDDYDSDDSERDLRSVEAVFLRFRFHLVLRVFTRGPCALSTKCFSTVRGGHVSLPNYY